MTSLELRTLRDHVMREPSDWGTGGEREEKKSSIWVAKSPSWHYSGQPAHQYYDLTSLKRSDLRLNDQLLPKPQEEDIGKYMLDMPYPGEHPYTSHIPRVATFPSFESPYDPKTGLQARRQFPKNPHVPASAYDILVLHKTKGGHADRHEIQALPPESMKKPLHWNDHDFDQYLKYPNAHKQTYYPTPAKLFVPNLEERSDRKCYRGNMVVTPRTADTTQNVQRHLWQTTYDLSHTGLGPGNPIQLDNYHDKQRQDGDDDSLYPRSVRTFEPAEPVEGRIARGLTPKPAPQTGRYPNSDPDPNYHRMLTESEKEEHRLLNGYKHANLPETPGGDIQWQQMQAQANPEMGLAAIEAKRAQLGDVTTWLPASVLPGAEDEVTQLAREKYLAVQQMEAQNRWKLLESQTPQHDTSARQHKMALASTKAQPGVFYEHEGRYQRERAGLYKTSYDPYTLQHAMKHAERSGGRLFDVSDCHQNALDLPVELNNEVADLIRYNRTLGGPPGSVPQFHDQPSQFEAIGPFDKTKAIQTSQLQPNSRSADPCTQEGGVILKETSYGEIFNTKKFLQENELPIHARNEPLTLMSQENQDVNQVRLTTAVVGGCSESRRPSTAPERARDAQPISVQAVRSHPAAGLVNLPVKLDTDRIASRHFSSGGNQFVSRSTNFMPSTSNMTWNNKSSYGNQFASPIVDLSFKKSGRAHWTPESGTPRPQTALLDIQAAFNKSKARQHFHHEFPENSPDLRENIISGMKHDFAGMNAQVLRGATLVQVN